MTHTATHTPLDKATRAIPMLYAEAFAGSNNKEFVVELYEDARLLEKAAPAMYEALVETMRVLRSLRDNKEEWYTLVTPELLTAWDKNKAVLAQAEGRTL